MENWSLHVKTKLRLMTALVWSVALCGCETWTIKSEDKRRIQDFEMTTSQRLQRVKPGFHYPSWRPELTARVDGWPVSITRQHGPCWRARVSTSRVDGPSNLRHLAAFVCLSVCPHDNSKTNDHKVFKPGTENDLRIAYKRYAFEVKRWKVRVRVKHTEGDRVAGVSFALYRSSAQSLV